MARRMFSPDIVGSDAFFEMPTSSQALYFHLGMYADDDGFVNPKKIMRMANVADDDLKVLVAKRFVLPFENGVVVIKHWRINNLIRKDWYKETQYVEEKARLKIKENGSYTELVNVSLTDRQHRLGKDRLGKDSIEREDGAKAPTPADEAREFFNSKDKQEEVLKLFVEKYGGQKDFFYTEIKKFIFYWTERNKSGTKQRWETEKTFEVKRRLVTWFNNNKNFNSIKSTGRGVA